MTIYFDSNSGATLWAATTAYVIGDKINATTDTEVFTFECTVAGTTNGSEPSYPAVAGGTVVDGTVTWTAKDPDSWSLAMLSIERANNAWIARADRTIDIYGEKLHSEVSASTMTLTASSYVYDMVPSIYRVDKSTGLYAPSKTDGSSNINFKSGLNQYLQVHIQANFNGFRFDAGGYFRPGKYTYRFEDCVIYYSRETSAQSFYINENSHSVFLNCLISALNFAGSTLQIDGNSETFFIGCTFNINSSSTGWITQISNGPTDFQQLTFIDCDLSGVNQPALFDSSSMASGVPTINWYSRAYIKFIRCALPTSYVIWDGVWVANTVSFIEIEGCSDPVGLGGELYYHAFRNYVGSRATEGNIYLTAGYFEPTAGKRSSQRLATESTIIQSNPLYSSKIGVFVEVAGSKVYEVEMLENFTTALTNKDIWVEFYYYKASTDSFHTIDTSTKRFAALTYTALPAGAGLSAWTGITTGYRSVKLQVPVTIGRTGIAYAVIGINKYEAGKSALLNPLLKAA